MAQLAPDDKWTTVAEATHTVDELVRRLRAKVEHIERKEPRVVQFTSGLYNLLAKRIFPCVLDKSKQTDTAVQNAVRFASMGGIDDICRIIELIPSQNDEDIFCAPVKMAAYEILCLVVYTNKYSTSGLVSYLREDVARFKALFFCKCYTAEGGTVCHMESIVRILRFLLQYYPEYTVVCDAANMVEMTEMHFPHVGVCLLGATTEKDQNKYRRYFCHVLLLLRTLCFDGTIQWDAYTQMIDVDDTPVPTEDPVPQGEVVPELEFGIVTELNTMQGSRMDDSEWRCVCQILPLVPKLFKLADSHETLTEEVEFLETCIEKTTMKQKRRLAAYTV